MSDGLYFAVLRAEFREADEMGESMRHRNRRHVIDTRPMWAYLLLTICATALISCSYWVLLAAMGGTK